MDTTWTAFLIDFLKSCKSCSLFSIAMHCPSFISFGQCCGNWLEGSLTFLYKKGVATGHSSNHEKVSLSVKSYGWMQDQYKSSVAAEPAPYEIIIQLIRNRVSFPAILGNRPSRSVYFDVFWIFFLISKNDKMSLRLFVAFNKMEPVMYNKIQILNLIAKYPTFFLNARGVIY